MRMGIVACNITLANGNDFFILTLRDKLQEKVHHVRLALRIL